MNSANRQKLLQEYADQNRRPLQMKINNEAVIIPVEYTLSGSAEEIQKNFLADYFDQQKDERMSSAGIHESSSWFCVGHRQNITVRFP